MFYVNYKAQIYPYFQLCNNNLTKSPSPENSLQGGALRHCLVATYSGAVLQ